MPKLAHQTAMPYQAERLDGGPGLLYDTNFPAQQAITALFSALPGWALGEGTQTRYIFIRQMTIQLKFI